MMGYCESACSALSIYSEYAEDLKRLSMTTSRFFADGVFNLSSLSSCMCDDYYFMPTMEGDFFCGRSQSTVTCSHLRKMNSTGFVTGLDSAAVDPTNESDHRFTPSSEPI
jgi:hypothetical protein